MTLTRSELAVASDLAAQGYGYENIWWRLSITDPADRAEMRRFILRLKTKHLNLVPMLERGRANRKRKPASARSSAPVTLASVSICGND